MTRLKKKKEKEKENTFRASDTYIDTHQAATNPNSQVGYPKYAEIPALLSAWDLHSLSKVGQIEKFFKKLLRNLWNYNRVKI